MAADHGDLNYKEVVIADENEQYTDTIRIKQDNTQELLHNGSGNSVGAL